MFTEPSVEELRRYLTTPAARSVLADMNPCWRYDEQLLGHDDEQDRLYWLMMDVDDEVCWRADARSLGRHRVWVPGRVMTGAWWADETDPGAWVAYDGKWWVDFEVNLALRYVSHRTRDFQTQLAAYPQFDGVDWASWDLVMAAMSYVLKDWPAESLRETFINDGREEEVEEFLNMPGMRQLAFESGFYGELPGELWDTVDMVVQLDTRRAFHRLMKLSAEWT